MPLIDILQTIDVMCYYIILHKGQILLASRVKLIIDGSKSSIIITLWS